MFGMINAGDLANYWNKGLGENPTVYFTAEQIHRIQFVLYGCRPSANLSNQLC